MSDTPQPQPAEPPPAARPAETFAEAEDALLSRWPETKLKPSLDRIEAFTTLLADPPVDVAVVEVGLGGAWDATNVADGAVAVVLPIAVDHAKYLGESAGTIAIEKAGIIKPGATAILAQQEPDAAAVLLARATEVGATVAREGVEFGVVSRVPAVGGQVVSLQGLRQRYDELFLPLYGAHQAQNAAVA